MAESKSSKSAAKHSKRFINEVQFSETWDIPVNTLRKMRLLGQGPIFYKLGSSVRYTEEDIEAWIQTLPRGGAGVPSSDVRTA